MYVSKHHLIWICCYRISSENDTNCVRSICYTHFHPRLHVILTFIFRNIISPAGLADRRRKIYSTWYPSTDHLTLAGQLNKGIPSGYINYHLPQNVFFLTKFTSTRYTSVILCLIHVFYWNVCIDISKYLGYRISPNIVRFSRTKNDTQKSGGRTIIESTIFVRDFRCE